MSLAADLLEQASHLARREKKHPRQASLRRAVSSAYYALFHLLVQDAAANAAPAAPAGLRELIKRAFGHAEMKKVCQGIVSAKPPLSTQRLLSHPLDKRLIAVLTTFVDLQEARHIADYDTSVMLDRSDVLLKIQQVRDAFGSWAAVRTTPNAVVFLSTLLLQKNLSRQPTPAPSP